MTDRPTTGLGRATEGGDPAVATSYCYAASGTRDYLMRLSLAGALQERREVNA
ncbi:hypothetical protein LV79_003166 [Actinokineospora globicatena]|nr:hypothetical protein [Actinokineospora globicatena]GLW79405.1 hypothetical protein Aglo01_38870 [Actinokineospora globicatena]GLW86185.1 hypothetical protein Aglo02_38240 [Actinokineospora globicatena]